MRGFLAGVLFAVLASGGCEVSAEHDVREVCEAYCDCTAPLPAANRQCNAECVAEIGGATIPDACVECFEQAACHDWQDCAAACN